MELIRRLASTQPLFKTSMIRGRYSLVQLRGAKSLESVRRDYAGLHSFLSISLIEARRRKASALRLRFSQSLARRLHRPSHANVRSTTHRFGRTTNPFAWSERLTISTFTRAIIFATARRNSGP